MTRFVLLLAAVALVARAQAPRGPSPTEQYHVGAQAYIDGDNARALQAVEAGLAVAPDDAKLQALRDLLQQQQQEQDQQDGGQPDDAQNQDPGDQGDEGDQGEDGDQSRQPEQPDDGGQEAEQDQTRTQQPDEAGSGDAPPQPASREPDEMTASQAERILDAVGGEERLLLRELRRAPTQRRRSDKDW
ncbi:hypothetical protein [Rubrivirga marina]|uniref:Uncharacterized protein n=1 Tax=Rubrivirga marina TaxID=1196024 RepID=A0A271J4T7_9BACT|nr:hypothetical protein [Rubrivirga marina]PAP78541.1 hypothetical protein BSZ37_19980 [Rubrivirga marina]